MAITYTDTDALPKVSEMGQGKFTEILNDRLCGAKNVVASLRWLSVGDYFDAGPDAKTHQLIYFLDGEATITLNDSDQQVAKGAGIYLEPSESARITHRGDSDVKLFHLIVP